MSIQRQGKLAELDPELTNAYSYDEFQIHIKCSFVAFWMGLTAFLYTSTVMSADSGEMDEKKRDFTFGDFFYNAFRRLGIVTQELEMLAFTEELLKEAAAWDVRGTANVGEI